MNLERKCRSNIKRTYIFYFILGIHTVRGVYVPFLMDWGGLNFFEIMILQSFFTFCIFLLEIPSGAIADFLGRTKGLSLGAAMVSLAALLYSIIPNFFLFLLAEGVWAFAMALISGTDEAFMYSNLKHLGEEEKLPKVLGRIQTISLIALTISAPIGSIMAQVISLQFTMNFLAITFFIAFIASLFLYEPPLENGMASKDYLHIIKSGFKELKENKILRILCFDRVLIDVLVFFMFWLYQPYLSAIQVPIFMFGFITAMMNIINAVFMNLIPKMSKNFKNQRLFLILVDIIIGTAYIILGLTTNIILGIIILLIIVGFGYPRALIYVNGINKQVESDNRATVLSTVNMFGSLARAIIYPFIGLIVMWNVFAVFIVIGILIILFALSTRVKKEYL